MSTKERLKIALQKGGRLNDDSIALLEQCGLQFNLDNSSLISSCLNYPIDLLFVRDDDIPTLVLDGISDLGIVGRNVYYEKIPSQETIRNMTTPLGFCECRLSIAVPKKKKYTGIQWLQNARIATSYPNILQEYLNLNNISAEIVTISGSVELAPSIGMAEAICDIVSSGKTLAENGLIEVEKVLDSEAILIKSELNMTEDKTRITEELMMTIKEITRKRYCKEICL